MFDLESELRRKCKSEWEHTDKGPESKSLGLKKIKVFNKLSDVICFEQSIERMFSILSLQPVKYDITTEQISFWLKCSKSGMRNWNKAHSMLVEKGYKRDLVSTVLNLLTLFCSPSR